MALEYLLIMARLSDPRLPRVLVAPSRAAWCPATTPVDQLIGTVIDIMMKVPPLRAVFVDHPAGRTFGPPHDQQRNEAVLTKALAELPNFTHPGEIRHLQFQCELNGSPVWEDGLRATLLHDRGN